jgi:UBX domain
LIACGFQVVDAQLSLLSKSENADKCLVLSKENEITNLLVDARCLLAKKAIEVLNMTNKELPKFKPPVTITRSSDENSSISSIASQSGFDPYKFYRYDAKSAAIGQNLGPESNYVSPTEQKLQALQSAQRILEQSLQNPILDREVVAYLPNSSSWTGVLEENVRISDHPSFPSTGPSDSSLLASQLQRREQDRRKREDQGFTTKAMRAVDKLSKQKVYSHVQLRIQFSDGSAIEAKFLPKETIMTVKDVIQESILLPNADFDLYVAPPRRKLSELSTLEEEGLVPAAKIFLSWKGNGVPEKGAGIGSFLKSDLFLGGGPPSFPIAKPIAITENKSDYDTKISREDMLLQRMLGKSGKPTMRKGEDKGTGDGKPKWFKR